MKFPMPSLVIGHFELVPGMELDFLLPAGLVRYMSIQQAIWEESVLPSQVKTSRGFMRLPDFELHFENTEEDLQLLAPARARAESKRRDDKLNAADGWARPQEKDAQ